MPGATTTEETKYIYNMDQNVQGNGFFNSYQDLAADELSLAVLDHGKRLLAPGCDPVANDLSLHSLGQPVLDEEIQVWNHSMEI